MNSTNRSMSQKLLAGILFLVSCFWLYPAVFQSEDFTRPIYEIYVGIIALVFLYVSWGVWTQKKWASIVIWIHLPFVITMTLLGLAFSGDVYSATGSEIQALIPFFCLLGYVLLTSILNFLVSKKLFSHTQETTVILKKIENK